MLIPTYRPIKILGEPVFYLFYITVSIMIRLVISSCKILVNSTDRLDFSLWA